ncbi:MAG TPA: DUF4173 domain-containing protein [Longimicrobiales bacterium]
MKDALLDARRLVRVALIAAIPMELLLRAIPGVNVPLALIAVTAALLAAVGPSQDGTWRTRAALCGVVLAMASIFAIRSESMLWLAAFVGTVATLGLIGLPDVRTLWRAEPIGVALRGLRVLAESAAGPLLLVQRGVAWPRASGKRAHLRGLAWSVPVVVPFLLLFGSADPILGNALTDLLDVPQLATHLAFWFALAWVGIGWLTAVHLPARGVALEASPVSARETLWVLAVLAVVFDVFVALQLRWFFGGDDLPRYMSGVTYAEYARRGFFELVAVAALLLAVLLVADWTTRKATRDERRQFRLLATLLLAFLAVVLVSAVQRMGLYVEVYGLTELRFFTMAFMIWLAVVFAWFAATTLRGVRDRFAAGVYVSGASAVLLLAAINPVARITQHNLEHLAAGGDFDVGHALGMSADAVPVLVAGLDRLEPAERCVLATNLLARFAGDPRPEDVDWRSWNYARQRARDVVADARGSLEGACMPAS